ncbi:hypothetical protein [Achromobacter xylosoxidans]|uniref:hypothetical protein n=1 Tax=Alcaligenes xylosoxydans xylosoxydans TaxID=85698 RepID=UPI000B48AE3D|nr:hypothetical protein [Achromobacter xylosoxidans]
MNGSLERLAKQLDLGAAANERLRLAFGRACAQRVEHLLEAQEAVDCLAELGRYLDGAIGREQLGQVSARAARLASRHQGSKSLDGCGHAAVSATYAVASALAGKALSAAEYAAYAAVYGQGGYGAVSDPESFEPEFIWQTERLNALAGGRAA